MFRKIALTLPLALLAVAVSNAYAEEDKKPEAPQALILAEEDKKPEAPQALILAEEDKKPEAPQLG